MPAVTASDLQKFLGRQVDPEQAQQVLSVVIPMIKSYVRGNGFVNGIPNDELRSVALTMGARLISHAGQVGQDLTRGPESVRWLATPVAFSVGELMVLNNFRVRAA